MIKKILILLSISIGVILSCTCPSSNPGTPSQLKADPTFELEEVIVDGVNYGKPYILGNLIVLKGEFSVSAGITSLVHECPKGYRLPTEREYTSLLTTLGSDAYNKLTDPDGFNMESGFFYMSETKTYPDETNGSLISAWEFKTLYLSGNSVLIKSRCSFFDQEKMKGRCVKDVSEGGLPVSITDKQIFTNGKILLTMDQKAVKGFVWRANGQISTVNPITVSYPNPGCYLIEAWGITLYDKVVYTCKPVTVIQGLGNDNDSSFDLSKVTVEDTGVKTYRINQIFFNHAQAPVAPTTNGGYYMVYTSNPGKTLHLRYTTSATSTVKDIDLKIDGYPMDVCETDYGLAIYALGSYDVNYAFVVGLEKDTFKVKFNTTVMNNGAQPTNITEQITFYSSGSSDSSEDVPLFGMQAMFAPENGKLSYGNCRLSLIFAHYNNFGANSPNRNDHTGDTLLTFDDNGDDIKYAWSWAASHSLIQDQIYDGKYFVTAALGDAYPEGIQVSFIDGQSTASTVDPVLNRKAQHYSWSREIVSFTGTQTGKSYGRLGGIIYLGLDTYAIIYSVKPTSSESRDIIAILTFKFSNGVFSDIENKTILTGVASYLVNMRAVKYGNKILITYTLNSKSFGTDVPRDYSNLTDTMYYLLVKTDGTVVNGPIEAKEHQMNLSDSLRPMKDGSLIWTYVDSSNNLKVVKVKAP